MVNASISFVTHQGMRARSLTLTTKSLLSGSRSLSLSILRKLQQMCQQGRRAECTARIDGNTYTVRVEKGLKGPRYFIGDVRTDCETLLALTCEEPNCPVARDVKDRFLGIRRKSAKKGAHLLEVVELGQGLECREAVFPIVIRCPNHRHPPMEVRVKGWDLFSKGAYVAGGLVTARGRVRPMFSSPEEACYFLD